MVMLVLKRHPQFWFSVIALHKLGAVVIPATNLLTAKDFVYRCNAADVKMVVCTGDGDVTKAVDEALPQLKNPLLRAVTSAEKATDGWLDFNAGIEAASERFERPTGEAANKNADMMLLYFTSGTTGYPKMVWHDFTYPLGHIVTARYWHNVDENGIHFTVADTGWG
jgi:acetyl-CoA synthetase